MFFFQFILIVIWSKSFEDSKTTFWKSTMFKNFNRFLVGKLWPFDNYFCLTVLRIDLIYWGSFNLRFHLIKDPTVLGKYSLVICTISLHTWCRNTPNNPNRFFALLVKQWIVLIGDQFSNKPMNWFFQFQKSSFF